MREQRFALVQLFESAFSIPAPPPQAEYPGSRCECSRAEGPKTALASRWNSPRASSAIAAN